MSSSNTFGNYFRFTTFGESHGEAIGVVLDGCPAGIVWDHALLQKQMNRRKPGQVDSVTQQVLVSARAEDDVVEVLSGVFEGKTLGTPIACIIKNTNQNSKDYDKIKNTPRIGHADDVWKEKFGHSDYRGGGRSSARETASRVIAGSVAQMFLKTKYPELIVASFVTQIGDLKMTSEDRADWSKQWTQKDAVEAFTARFPTSQSNTVKSMLLAAKQEGNSYGGEIETWITGAPRNLGEPIFEKLKSKLAQAAMSIGATTSFEVGAGKDLISKSGKDVHVSPTSEVYGGIRGGISTGEKIIFKVGFKPTATIHANATEGRHDPCVLPRAIPILEAMSWVVLADLELAMRGNRV